MVWELGETHILLEDTIMFLITFLQTLKVFNALLMENLNYVLEGVLRISVF